MSPNCHYKKLNLSDKIYVNKEGDDSNAYSTILMIHRKVKENIKPM